MAMTALTPIMYVGFYIDSTKIILITSFRSIRNVYFGLLFEYIKYGKINSNISIGKHSTDASKSVNEDTLNDRELSWDIVNRDNGR